MQVVSSFTSFRFVSRQKIDQRCRPKADEEPHCKVPVLFIVGILIVLVEVVRKTVKPFFHQLALRMHELLVLMLRDSNHLVFPLKRHDYECKSTCTLKLSHITRLRLPPPRVPRSWCAPFATRFRFRRRGGRDTSSRPRSERDRSREPAHAAQAAGPTVPQTAAS